MNKKDKHTIDDIMTSLRHLRKRCRLVSIGQGLGVDDGLKVKGMDTIPQQ